MDGSGLAVFQQLWSLAVSASLDSPAVHQCIQQAQVSNALQCQSQRSP